MVSHQFHEETKNFDATRHSMVSLILYTSLNTW